MANITIAAPFTLEIKGDCFINARPTDKRAEVQVGDVSSFTYTLGEDTANLPTSGSANSNASTASANLTALDDTDTGGAPTEPFKCSFNTGTAARVPATGSPYIVSISSVDEDLIISGAASAGSFESGGVVVLDGGSGSPTHPE